MAGACLDQAQPCWRSLCPCLCRPPRPNTLTIQVAPRFAPQLPRPASSHSLLFTTPTPPVVQCGAACSSAVVPACGPRYLLLSTESGAVCATCGQQHRVVSGGVAVRLPLAAVPQEACKRSTRSPGATAPDVRAMCVTKGGGEPRPGSALHASCKDTHVEDRHVEAEVPLHPRAVPAPVGVGGVGGVGGWGGTGPMLRSRTPAGGSPLHTPGGSGPPGLSADSTPARVLLRRLNATKHQIEQSFARSSGRSAHSVRGLASDCGSRLWVQAALVVCLWVAQQQLAVLRHKVVHLCSRGREGGSALARSGQEASRTRLPGLSSFQQVGSSAGEGGGDVKGTSIPGMSGGQQGGHPRPCGGCPCWGNPWTFLGPPVPGHGSVKNPQAGRELQHTGAAAPPPELLGPCP